MEINNFTKLNLSYPDVTAFTTKLNILKNSEIIFPHEETIEDNRITNSIIKNSVIVLGVIFESFHDNLIIKDGYDLVSGWKKKRYDSKLTKNLPSKLFNAAARKTSGVKLHDFNCGLKAYNQVVVKNIDVYGEMHRYIPVLAKNAGFINITEKVVKHQARKYGTTKFGAERFINGFLDLITIWFLSRFAKRPMHLFGALGVLMFIIGSCSAIYIGISKLYKLAQGLPAILVTNNPWFYIALTTMIIGTQLFLAGFLGELILRSKRQQERYRIAETIA